MVPPGGVGLVEHVELTTVDGGGDVVADAAEHLHVRLGRGRTGGPADAELRGLRRGDVGLLGLGGGGGLLRLPLLLAVGVVHDRDLVRRGRGAVTRPRVPGEDHHDHQEDQRTGDHQGLVGLQGTTELGLPADREAFVGDDGHDGLRRDDGLRGLGGLRRRLEEAVEVGDGLRGRGDGVGLGGGFGPLRLLPSLLALDHRLRRLRRRLLLLELLRLLPVPRDVAGQPTGALVLAGLAGRADETAHDTRGIVLRAHGTSSNKLLTRSRADAPESDPRLAAVYRFVLLALSGILELRPSEEKQSDGEFGLLTGKIITYQKPELTGQTSTLKGYTQKTVVKKGETHVFNIFSNSFQQAKIPTFGTSE